MTTSKATEQFILGATAVHGDRYDYSKSIYINSKKKIIIICNLHGDFLQSPLCHINRKNGCKKCATDKVKITKEQFIERSKVIHNNKFDYSMVELNSTKDKVIIICPTHKEFQQTAANHMYGRNCRKCKYENLGLMSQEEFLTKAHKKHGDKFDYSKAIYINAHKKITLICNKNHEFQQKAYLHLYGNGCIACYQEEANKRVSDLGKAQTLTREEFIARSNKKHNNYYNYDKTIYQGSDKKVTITCPTHGDFEQEAASHYRGCGCPKCAKKFNTSENLWLDYLNIPKDKQHRQVPLYIDEKKFIVDGFNPETKTIYEFNGDFWHGNPKYYSPEKYNKIAGEFFGILYKKTLAKKTLLEQNGYKVISIWEKDFIKNYKILEK